jgi:caffeoyl-CoA O-methyltransferase
MNKLTRKTVVFAMAALIVNFLILCMAGLGYCEPSTPLAKPSDLDAQISRFLKDERHSWTGWNVPYEDGKILYNLIIKGQFRNILEVGTSTGHSTIWLA